MSVKMSVALSAKDHSQLVYIDDVDSGLACGAVCPECNGQLMAKKGDDLAHHFSHYSDKHGEHDGGDVHGCSWGLETELHLLAKMAISKARTITIPIGTIKPVATSFAIEDTALEKSVGEKRPDVILFSDGDRLLVEVAVTHFSDKDKIQTYRRGNISAIEIDFSSFKHSSERIKPSEVLDHIKSTATKWLSIAPSGTFGKATHERDRFTMREELRLYRKRLAEIEAERSVHQQEIDSLSKRMRWMKRDLNEARDELKEKNEQLRLAKKSLEDLEPEKAKLVSIREDARHDYVSAKNERAEAEKTLDEARKELENSEKKLEQSKRIFEEAKALPDVYEQNVAKLKQIQWSLAKLALMQLNLDKGREKSDRLEDVHVLHWVKNIDELIPVPDATVK